MLQLIKQIVDNLCRRNFRRVFFTEFYFAPIFYLLLLAIKFFGFYVKIVCSQYHLAQRTQ